MKYTNYTRTEAAEMLIIEKYKENIVNDSVLVHKLTRQIVVGAGNQLNAMLMMAQVNTLIENKEVEGYE